MDINDYDESGHTPLIIAAIEGDVEEVKRLLALGADPDIADESWGTTKAVNFAGRLAKTSDSHRAIYELLISASFHTQTDVQDSLETTESIKPVHAVNDQKSTWQFETVDR